MFVQNLVIKEGNADTSVWELQIELVGVDGKRRKGEREK
jgi:hypothetical protein